jgi:membrane protease YdiL (CAAX protease family)
VTVSGLRREVARLLRDDSGRIRLGWRLALWALLLAAGLVLLGPVLPPGVSGVAGPLLGAGLLSGWALLALDGRPPAALGFHAGRDVFREIAWGTGLGVGVAGAALALAGISGAVTWAGEGGTPTGWLLGALAALGWFALPAAAEEVVFRGYAFQAMAESWGAAAALAVTSLGFGFLHMVNPGAHWMGAVNVAAAGVFLGLVLLRTGSLWWATAVHLGWNWTLGYAADLPVSGLDVVDAPLVSARTSGADWLSGGAFGLEGGVLATVAFVGAALWAWRTGWLSPCTAMRDAEPLALLEGPTGAPTDRSPVRPVDPGRRTGDASMAGEQGGDR